MKTIRVHKWFNSVTESEHEEIQEIYTEELGLNIWNAHYVIQVLSSNPPGINEELWSRILADPNETFIGLCDAGIIKGEILQLRRFERIATRKHDVIEVLYFLGTKNGI